MASSSSSSSSSSGQGKVHHAGLLTNTLKRFQDLVAEELSFRFHQLGASAFHPSKRDRRPSVSVSSAAAAAVAAVSSSSSKVCPSPSLSPSLSLAPLDVQHETHQREQKDDTSDNPIWSGFPRNCDFYARSIITYGKLSKKCLEIALDLVLEWLPDHSRDYCTLESPQIKYGSIPFFNYPKFLESIVGFNQEDPRHSDIAVCSSLSLDLSLS